MDVLESDDVRMLVDIGFIALSAGLDPQARTIFAGVEAARPDQEAGPIGLALAEMAADELDSAVARLKALPPSDAALTYLGMALMRRGDTGEGRETLRRVLETAPGTPFAELAAASLGETGGA